MTSHALCQLLVKWNIEEQANNSLAQINIVPNSLYGNEANILWNVKLMYIH